MSSRLICLLLLLVLSLSAACAPLRSHLVGEPVSQAFADELMQAWFESAAGVSTLQGLAKVKVQAPLNSLNGSQVILAQKPDRLRAETLSPFGTPMLMLAADGGTLEVSLPGQNVYYTGAASPANLDLFVHLPLRLSDLVDVLLYQPPLIKAWKEEAFSLQKGGWLLVRHGTLRRQELVFNPLRQLVEVSFYKNNDLFMKINYAQIPEQGEPFPYLLSLEIPDNHTTVSLEFSEVKTNGELRPDIFQLVRPPGAKVVYLNGE
jgi:outer membrane lipoprotein-sorting protein